MRGFADNINKGASFLNQKTWEDTSLVDVAYHLRAISFLKLLRYYLNINGISAGGNLKAVEMLKEVAYAGLPIPMALTPYMSSAIDYYYQRALIDGGETFQNAMDSAEEVHKVLEDCIAGSIEKRKACIEDPTDDDFPIVKHLEAYGDYTEFPIIRKVHPLAQQSVTNLLGLITPRFPYVTNVELHGDVLTWECGESSTARVLVVFEPATGFSARQNVLYRIDDCFTTLRVEVRDELDRGDWTNGYCIYENKNKEKE